LEAGTSAVPSEPVVTDISALHRSEWIKSNNCADRTTNNAIRIQIRH
jgi:hypothetical protein